MTSEQFFRLGVTSAAKLKEIRGVSFNLFVAQDKIKSKNLSEFRLTEFKDINGNDKTHLFNSIPNIETNSLIENLETRQFRVYSRINAVADLIYISSNKYPNTCIVNVQVANILKNICKKLEIRDNNYTITDCKYIGNIGIIAIYLDHNMKYEDTRIALGYNDNNKDENVLYNESFFFTFAINTGYSNWI